MGIRIYSPSSSRACSIPFDAVELRLWQDLVMALEGFRP